MPSLGDRIFRHAPWPLKDALCSVYGWRLHRQRYGGMHDQHLKQALEEERLSSDELCRLSLQRLRRTLIRAAQEVPYYRGLFRRLRLDPETLPLPEGLASIPILQKSTVRERHDEFISEALDRRRLVVRETSGTTGEPLSVVVDLESLQRIYALYDRFRAWAGTKVGMRRATFNARVLFPAARSRPPFWVRDWTENNLLFSIYHMSPATLPHYVRRLASYDPEEVHAYPSALVTLARFARTSGMSLPRPKALIVSAETLMEPDRELLQEAFDCPVHNQYGNAEMTLFAAECAMGGLHLDTAYGYLETVNGYLDDVGRHVGEAVSTGYGNRAMPLIRYHTGDTVAFAPEPCQCGRPHPVLAQVVGRTDDLLIMPDGRIVGRLDPVFKGLHGLRKAQIVQDRRDRVLVKVVPEPDYGAAVEQALRAALAERLGPSVTIEVRPVAEIPRSPGGKFRAVVRRID